MRRNEEGLKSSKLRPQNTDKGIFWYKIYIRVPLSRGFWYGRGLVSNGVSHSWEFLHAIEREGLSSKQVPYF